MKRIFAALLACLVLMTGCAFAEDWNYVTIVPEGDPPYTENGYVFTGDAAFNWSTDGSVVGYSYIVEDFRGFDVPGYSSYDITDQTGITLDSDDFIPGKTYTITVYAHETADEAYPYSWVEWFTFEPDSGDNGGNSGGDNSSSGGSNGGGLTFTPTVDRRDAYMNYFDAHFAGDTPVCLADVTGDGLDEMIVLFDQGDMVAGSVLTVDGYTGEVKLIYQTEISAYHGGICGWYLIPQDDGNYALLEETDEMWQGMGRVSFMEYRLTENGDVVQLRNLWLSSDESGVVDDNGVVLDFIFDDYANQLGEVLFGGYVLYRSASVSSALVSQQNMKYDNAFASSGSGGGPMSAIYSDGLIAMMDMDYFDIHECLENVVYYDSYDNPGNWYMDGEYASGHVYFEYYEQPDNPGAYPFRMTVMDDNGMGYLPVTTYLCTGMSWAQVKQMDWVDVDGFEDLGEFGGVATGYPEQGLMLSMLFSSADDDGILTSVTIEFFE